MICKYDAFRTSQRGATLIVALLVLIIIALIGVMTVISSNSQYRLAGNVQFEDSALNNAEAAIAAAENWLSIAGNGNSAGFTTYDSAATPHLYPVASVIDPISLSWGDSNSLSVSVGQRYYIQLISTGNVLAGSSQSVGGRKSAACNTVNTYEVTALGESARGARKILRSFFSVLSC